MPRATEMNPYADVERARRWLRRDPPTSRAVHEARKRLKRARAVLRLGEGSPAGAGCRRAGAACRRAARALAPLRDARVFSDTMRRLAEGADGRSAARARSRGLALASRAERAEARALKGGAAFRRALAALRACPRGPDGAAFGRAVAGTLGQGLRRSFRRGRRAMRAARARPGKANSHALRKESRWLLHDLEQTAGRFARLEDLRRLDKVLGREHDLSVLRERLERSSDGAEVSALRRLARRRRKRLRRRALSLAAKVFSGKGRFVAGASGEP